MKVISMMEHDLPKDETRLRKFALLQGWRECRAQKYQAYLNIMDQLTQEGKLTISIWTDNSWHIIQWFEYESMEAFVPLWSLEAFHKLTLEFNPLVDNLQVRLLRPSRIITEDVTP